MKEGQVLGRNLLKGKSYNGTRHDNGIQNVPNISTVGARVQHEA